MSKRWLKVELEYLRRYAEAQSPQQLAERMHTDPETVEAKLRELSIDTAANKARAESEIELIETFERGMKALYAEKWKSAAKALSQVAEGDGPPEVVARARQYAKVAAARAGDDDDTDPYLRAVMLKNAGEYDEALTLCKRSRKPSDAARFAYLAATIEVLREDLEAAADHLTKAYDLDPRSRGQARLDPDLELLRSAEEFESLFAVEA